MLDRYDASASRPLSVNANRWERGQRRRGKDLGASGGLRGQLAEAVDPPRMRGKRGTRGGVNSVMDAVFTASRLDDSREMSQVQVANAWKEMVLDLVVQPSQIPRQHPVSRSEVDRGFDLVYRPLGARSP